MKNLIQNIPLPIFLVFVALWLTGAMAVFIKSQCNVVIRDSAVMRQWPTLNSKSRGVAQEYSYLHILGQYKNDDGHLWFFIQLEEPREGFTFPLASWTPADSGGLPMVETTCSYPEHEPTGWKLLESAPDEAMIGEVIQVFDSPATRHRFNLIQSSIGIYIDYDIDRITDADKRIFTNVRAVDAFFEYSRFFCHAGDLNCIRLGS